MKSKRFDLYRAISQSDSFTAAAAHKAFAHLGKTYQRTRTLASEIESISAVTTADGKPIGVLTKTKPVHWDS